MYVLWQEHCLNSAEECLSQARLVALQLSVLNQNKQVINLDPKAVLKYMEEHPFAEVHTPKSVSHLTPLSYFVACPGSHSLRCIQTVHLGRLGQSPLQASGHWWRLPLLERVQECVPTDTQYLHRIDWKVCDCDACVLSCDAADVEQSPTRTHLLTVVSSCVGIKETGRSLQRQQTT